jgi:hypothetical protein
MNEILKEMLSIMAEMAKHTGTPLTRIDALRAKFDYDNEEGVTTEWKPTQIKGKK